MERNKQKLVDERIFQTDGNGQTPSLPLLGKSAINTMQQTFTFNLQGKGNEDGHGLETDAKMVGYSKSNLHQETSAKMVGFCRSNLHQETGAKKVAVGFCRSNLDQETGAKTVGFKRSNLHQETGAKMVGF